MNQTDRNEHSNHNSSTVSYPTKAVKSFLGTPAFFATLKNRVNPSNNRLERKRVCRVILYILLCISLLNTVIMTFHLLDDDYSFPIINTSYISAIYPNQNIDQTVRTKVVKMVQFAEQDIELGSYVVIESDFGIDEFWVEQIVGINPTAKQLVLTYDQLSTKKVSYDQIYGIYQKEANILGNMYYTAKFTEGYFLIIVSNLFVLGTYYFAFIGEYIYPKPE